ncbi:MAG: hypothetical protein ACLSDJ_07820, partial [Butyricimonas faecihominis]
MKYILLIIVTSISLSLFAQSERQDETIFRAMNDELQRTREQLHLQDLPTPFYVNYTVGRVHRFNVVGTLGSIVMSTEIPWSTQGGVQLLLGDYHRNSNVGELVMPIALPAEVDYNALRRGFWLGSDMMYKMSLQLLMKKAAYLKENPLSPEEESLDDWLSVPSVTRHVEQESGIETDLPVWENIAKEVSAIFLNYKDLYNTYVAISGSESEMYKLTSEGVSLKYPLSLLVIRVSANMKMPDGPSVSLGFSIEVKRMEDLPSLDEMKKQTIDFAEDVLKLKNASVIEGFYSGPVMFEDAAVATLFTANLLQKGALFANPTLAARNAGGLSGRFGGQIIDRRLSVKNYSTMKTYKGQDLKGYYEIDAEGMMPIPEVTLVDHGVFKAMLNGRIPAQNAPKSTGSSRIGEMAQDFASVTAPGTIHVQVDKGTRPEKMKANLLKAAKAKGLQYAYIVRAIPRTI